MLSYRAVCYLLGRQIFIYPFTKENLKGIGYNLAVSPHAWSLTKGETLAKTKIKGKEALIVDAADIALVWTNETIHVGKSIAGTLRSTAMGVMTGFSFVPTTLCPGWNGVILTTLKNMSCRVGYLFIDHPFVTIAFDKTDMLIGSVGKDPNLGGRVGLLRDRLKIQLSDDALRWIGEDFRQDIDHLKARIAKERPYDELPYRDDVDVILQVDH